MGEEVGGGGGGHGQLDSTRCAVLESCLGRPSLESRAPAHGHCVTGAAGGPSQTGWISAMLLKKGDSIRV